ncbi:ferredoxin reductase, partial [Delftia sp. ZNC0008]|uniref:ferredoxin reductase n=1 Tax=Delftia sp. ZNC0008 TaxID=1339242 RepID=UPI0018CD3B1D
RVGVLRLRLKAADGHALPRWTPGSHIDLQCGDTGLSRQYSLCGDPQDTGSYEIAVLRETNGRGGSAWVHEHLHRGATVQVRGPRNHFPLDEGASHLILVAGGIGITPISAMARRARA